MSLVGSSPLPQTERETRVTISRLSMVEQQMPKKAAGWTMQMQRGYCPLHRINQRSGRLAAIRKAEE
jgi:hypothetical protein